MRIELPLDIGGKLRYQIDQYRKKNNIQEPEEVKKFYNKNQTFLEEELAYIKTLELTGDCKKILSILDKFTKLDNLILIKANITSADIEQLAEKVPNLRSLYIELADGLKKVDISNLKNLEFLEIKSCPDLKRVIGINKAENLMGIDIYDNEELIYSGEQDLCRELVSRIAENKKNNKETSLNLDVMLFPEFEKAVKKHNEKVENGEIESNQIETSDIKTTMWCEKVNNNQDLGMLPTKRSDKDELKCRYAYSQMKEGDKEVDRIIQMLTDPKDSQMEKFVVLYSWLKDNVTYDYNSVKEENVKDNWNSKSFILKSPGMLSGILKRTCICEGYSRMFSYFLKKCNIEAHTFTCKCFKNKNERDSFESFEKDQTDHAIIETVFDNEGTYYSDLTFDAGATQRNENDTYKHMLLTKDEIEKDRKINDTYRMTVENSKKLSKEERMDLIHNAEERRKERGATQRIVSSKSDKKEFSPEDYVAQGCRDYGIGLHEVKETIERQKRVNQKQLEDTKEL